MKVSDTGGSSPLTRGKPRGVREGLGHGGLIPAHAGKTAGERVLGGVHWAHPRSRGENPRASLRMVSFMGSSPLTRGKLSRAIKVETLEGLIPAHAGKTPTWSTPTVACWAHPRSRGENLYGTRPLGRRYGSSPLTRGKHKHTQGHRPGYGLIPAHAGKTVVGCCQVVRVWAHPRSRGENIAVTVERGRDAGSSPLTRGKPSTARKRSSSVGLIPAHAGKTISMPVTGDRLRAHPRSRGENATARRSRRRHHGSSPLTRGKQNTPQKSTHRARLIPAHAGKTFGG